jgi:GntR family histidine utilization transcriptional repressor
LSLVDEDFVNTDPHPAAALQPDQADDLVRILSGDWRPGDRIASEAELVRDLGVSRMTINRALRELTLEGQLIRVQGVGTFVAESKAQSACSRSRTSPTRSRRGSRHEARLFSCDAKPPASRPRGSSK